MYDKSLIMKAFRDMTEGTRITSNVIDKLFEMGYFDAPASRSHHLSCECGLAVHSIDVAANLKELTEGMKLHWSKEDSPIVIGLLHDVCKCDQYRHIFNGAETYKWNEDQIIKGHGDKSVMLLSTIIPLTEEEMYCIRFHMGAFSDNAEERSDYSNAVQKYGNVLWTHTADMWASHIHNK